MRLTFHGVRGSTPSPCEQNRRYGGNTSSVVVHPDGEGPILLDLGTGARQYGLTMNEPFSGAIFVTHLHWDHIQGFPFFGPMLRPGADVTFYGPIQPNESLREALDSFIRPPLFPVTIDMLPCDFEAIAIANDEVQVGNARVMSREVPHTGGRRRPGAPSGSPHRLMMCGHNCLTLPVSNPVDQLKLSNTRAKVWVWCGR